MKLLKFSVVVIVVKISANKWFYGSLYSYLLKLVNANRFVLNYTITKFVHLV